MSSSSGFVLTHSFAEMFLGSPFTLPLPLLTPLGGGFCFTCLFRAKSAAVGDLIVYQVKIWQGENQTEMTLRLSAPCLLTDLDQIQFPCFFVEHTIYTCSVAAFLFPLHLMFLYRPIHVAHHQCFGSVSVKNNNKPDYPTLPIRVLYLSLGRQYTKTSTTVP